MKFQCSIHSFCLKFWFVDLTSTSLFLNRAYIVHFIFRSRVEDPLRKGRRFAKLLFRRFQGARAWLYLQSVTPEIHMKEIIHVLQLVFPVMLQFSSMYLVVSVNLFLIWMLLVGFYLIFVGIFCSFFFHINAVWHLCNFFSSSLLSFILLII